MTYRSIDWKHGLSRDLHKRRGFAKEYFISLLEEGEESNDAISHIIRVYGIKELAEKTGLPASNISRFISDPTRARDETANRILKPLGIKMVRRFEAA